MAIRIPNSVAEDAHITLGDEVEVHCDSDGRIVISKSLDNDLTEESILASLENSRIDGEYWDGPVGREEF